MADATTTAAVEEEKQRAPKRITMPGMIYHANEVLNWALDPATGIGLHPSLFGPSLLGIAFIEIVEVGFIFSGNVGTGILLARRGDGSWSPPAAIGLSGLGWGFIVGASLKHLVYLIYDTPTLKSMSGDVGVKISSQAEASVGTWGRTAEAANYLSNRGVGSNIALSYSQGLFGGISVEGAVCRPRNRVNEKFYGQPCSNEEILFSDEPWLIVPDGTLMPEVYTKLDRLCNGVATEDEAATTSPGEAEKVERIRRLAEQEGEEHLAEEEDVTFVVVEDEPSSSGPRIT